MKDTITYRPTIEPDRLTRIIRKLKYPKVNRFIDEAVREKIGRETRDPRRAKAEALLWEALEVLDQHKGVKFLKPGPELAKEIDRKAKGLLRGRAKGIRYKGSIKETFR